MDVAPEDWDLFSDALFLHEHPTWTWQALQGTPEAVVTLIRQMDKSTTKKRR
jgi:hypothetical protein